MSGHPSVAVVVINWNGYEDTCACLASLKASRYSPLSTILIDNGSRNDEGGRLAERFPWVDIILNQENLGFVEGCNAGIRRALQLGADMVMLLNNDTVVEPDFIFPLVETMERSPDLGAVGPLIEGPDRGIVWFAGGRLARPLVQPFHSHRGKPLAEVPRGLDHGDFLTGCCMLVRKEAILDVGFLDDRYFAYFEDLDWCVRMHAAGWRTVTENGSMIWHKGSGSTGLGSPLHLYLMTRNRMLFARHALTWTEKVFFFIPFYLSVRIAIPLVRTRCSRTHLDSVFRGIRDGLSGDLCIKHP